MNKTRIDWADYSWNPVTGCSKGCPYCYAKRVAKRHQSPDFAPKFHPDRLPQPQAAKRPSRVFCGSMGEIFDPMIEFDDVAEIFKVMIEANWHTYILLTKQPQRVKEFFQFFVLLVQDKGLEIGPLSFEHIYIGVSGDNQKDIDERMNQLKYAYHRRILSIEPMLEPVSVQKWVGPQFAYIGKTGIEAVDRGLKWVIMGGQTGPTKHPKMSWMDDVIGECWKWNVPVFVKDNTGWKNGPKEYPT